MTPVFTTDQLLTATFKLECDNNAMLRLILYNQDRMMKKMKIKQEFPSELFLEKFPLESEDNDREVMQSANYVRRLSDDVKMGLHEWLKKKTTFNDENLKPDNLQNN